MVYKFVIYIKCGKATAIIRNLICTVDAWYKKPGVTKTHVQDGTLDNFSGTHR